jgi:rhodanese-related sulfurtransferase
MKRLPNEKSPVHSMSKMSWFVTIKIIIVSFLLLIDLQGCDYLFPQLKSDKITVEEAASYLNNHKNDPDIVIIDLRSGNDFVKSHIEGALNMDYSQTDFPGRIEKLDKEKRYIIYDITDRNSLKTLELMREVRINKVHMIIGGFNEWIRLGLPVTKQ